MDKLICIGKNYLEHAKELGDAVPEKPVIFLKPPSCSRQARALGDTIEARLPQGRGSAHHECEIALKLDARGEITHVTLGLDMTLRELQATLKKNGHPWEVAKVFADSAILGAWIPVAEMPDYLDREFSLLINGSLRQKGRGREMRSAPGACIEHALSCFPLTEGDVMLTGTPAGVGPVQSGDWAELRWGERLIAAVRFV